MSDVNLNITIIISFVCLAGNLLVQFVSLGKLGFSLFAFTCFIRVVWQIRIQLVHLAGQFTWFIGLTGRIIIQSVYLGVMKEHCLPLDSSRKRSLPSGILPQILKFTPGMTSYCVTYRFSKKLPFASRDEMYKVGSKIRRLSTQCGLGTTNTQITPSRDISCGHQLFQRKSGLKQLEITK